MVKILLRFSSETSAAESEAAHGLLELLVKYFSHAFVDTAEDFIVLVEKCLASTAKVIFLLIYICNFHVLNHFLLIYIRKLHWNRKVGKPLAAESALHHPAHRRERDV